MPTPNRSGFKVPRSGFSIGRYGDKIRQEQYPAHGFHRSCRSSSYWKRSKYIAERAYIAERTDDGQVVRANGSANEMRAPTRNRSRMDSENENAPLAQGTAARLNSIDRGRTD